MRAGAGILTSRISGLFREAAVAFFFGVGPHADVFRSAFRAPNLIQNLLGEQTLSAAFIPIYSRMLGEGRDRAAARFAGAAFGLLFAVASGVALLGLLLARPLVALLTPGYLADAAAVAAGELSVDRFELAVMGIRILFPMMVFLILASWSLGVLNSHRRFFLPYVSPVLWNSAIIGALFYAGWSYVGEGTIPVGEQSRILIAAFAGGLVGGVLQFAMQLPSALSALGEFRPSFSLAVDGVREAVGNAGPVLAARGAAQISSYFDILVASLLAAGAVAAIGNATVLYLLPVSLFALSVAAAELPELSRQGGYRGAASERRTSSALRRIAFFVVPTQIGYIAFGFVIVGGLFRRGQFVLADNWLVYLLVAAYSVGLLATAWSRLLMNVYYAGGETRRPARIALARIGVALAIGVALMFWLDRFSLAEIVPGTGVKGEALRLGALGLGVGSAVASWFELWRLRGGLVRLGSKIDWPAGFVFASYGRALAALAVGFAVWYVARDWPQLPAAVAVVVGYALAYLSLAKLHRVPELDEAVRRLPGAKRS